MKNYSWTSIAPDPFFWRLKGPAAFFNRVCDHIDKNEDVFIALPQTAPPGVLGSLEDWLSQTKECVSVHMDEKADVEDAIASALHLPERATAWRLTQLQHPHVLVMKAYTQVAMQKVLDFTHSYAKQRTAAMASPIIVGRVPDNAISGDGRTSRAGFPTVVWKGVTSHNDIDLYVSFMMQKHAEEAGPPLHIAYVRALAGTDVCMADYLLRLKAQDVLEAPLSILATAQSMQAPWTSPTWLSGAVDDFGGQKTSHPLYEIMMDDRVAISRRLWEAQIKALFPWMELHRAKFIEPELRWIKQLPQPVMDKNGRPYDLDALEYNDVVNIAYFRAHREPKKDVPLFHYARAIRNDLAHGDPSSLLNINNFVKLALERLGRQLAAASPARDRTDCKADSKACS